MLLCEGEQMTKLPKEVMALLNHPHSTKVVATKTPKGDVHAIIVGSLSALDSDTIIFGTLIMHRTSENLREMRRKEELASVLVVKDTISYEVRARVKEQRMKGKELEFMNEQLLPMGLKMTSVWYLEPVEVYDQSASYDAGKRMV
jgi:hypothetical protein